MIRQMSCPICEYCDAPHLTDLIASIVTMADSRFAALWIWLVAAGPAVAQTPATPSLQSCGALPTDAQRLRCAERLAGPSGKGAQPGTALSGGWRLSRTQDPRSGTTMVAVTRTAEIKASDAGFAGLMFRCGPARLEALLVMLDPIPPSARPRVTVSSPGSETPFAAQVMQLGTLLQLPDPAMSLATTNWSTATEVSVAVDNGTSIVRGVVSTSGLAGALQVLRSSCGIQP